MTFSPRLTTSSERLWSSVDGSLAIPASDNKSGKVRMTSVLSSALSFFVVSENQKQPWRPGLAAQLPAIAPLDLVFSPASACPSPSTIDSAQRAGSAEC
jgi:hypothetical protein